MAGGVEAVVEIVKLNRDAPAALAACGALRNITFNNADNKDKCGVAGGVEAVRAAIPYLSGWLVLWARGLM